MLESVFSVDFGAGIPHMTVVEVLTVCCSLRVVGSKDL
jgi:hypothetical protein